MSDPAGDDPAVLVRVEDRLGHLTLNRPRRINALDLDMIKLVQRALDEWAESPDVDLVLIDGAGERGLCAGADIRTLWEGVRAGSGDPLTFLDTEYRMNATIVHFPKPVVAFMDGITFGGGVGISTHASVRVVTERSQVAMPETLIGLCPDVGSLFLLSRSPGELGTHAALTGARLDGALAVHAGLADHLIPSADLPGLVAQLRSGTVPPLPVSPPTSHPEWIDRCYAAETVEEIEARLRGDADPNAHAAADTLAQMSPTSLKVTLAAIRRAADLTLDQVLEQDLRVCGHFLGHPDLVEGIRAQIIDKDRRPRWQPADLADVTADQAASFFDPLD